MRNPDAAEARLRLREENGKRAVILRAAARLFSRRGYSETSVQDIADAAGTAVGTIYLYYRNKEDLLTGIYRHSSALLLERLTERIGGRTDPLEKYAVYIEEAIDYAFEHPDFFLIIFVDLRRKEIELPKRPAFGNFRRFLALGENIIREGQAGGQFSASLPAARLNLGIVSMWVGLVLTMVIGPAVKAGAVDLRQVKDLVLASVLEGIRTPAARQAPLPRPDVLPKRAEGKARRDD